MCQQRGQGKVVVRLLCPKIQVPCSRREPGSLAPLMPILTFSPGAEVATWGGACSAMTACVWMNLRLLGSPQTAFCSIAASSTLAPSPSSGRAQGRAAVGPASRPGTSVRCPMSQEP